jgi:DNA-binding XRE family transcriptional regulator
MKQRFKTYLRSHRRRWGLTQKEVAYLLGFKEGSTVSRIEREGKVPSLAVAFACYVLFGIPLADLFPGLHSEMEDAVLRRAYKLYDQLQGAKSTATPTKLNLLERMPKRAAERNATSQV